LSVHVDGVKLATSYELKALVLAARSPQRRKLGPSSKFGCAILDSSANNNVNEAPSGRCSIKLEGAEVPNHILEPLPAKSNPLERTIWYEQ